jgi:probable HAF family extracellular repeat protein
LAAAHDQATDVTHAVLWTPATGAVQILDPGVDLWPNDVDRNGLVVGLGDGGLEGFALDSVTGVYTPLLFGAPPPQVVGSAGATAVNVHGLAVGSEVVFQKHPAFPNDPPAWWEKPFLWSPATGMVELYVDPLGNSGRANDVEVGGWIVGHYLDAFYGQRPALWRDQGATLVDLGLPPTYPVAEATDVNALGQVLVVAPNDVAGFTRAFLWADGRYVDLSASMPPGAAWDVWTGEDIDARGEILAGVIPAGKDSPPEPLQMVVLVPRSRPKPAR